MRFIRKDGSNLHMISAELNKISIEEKDEVGSIRITYESSEEIEFRYNNAQTISIPKVKADYISIRAETVDFQLIEPLLPLARSLSILTERVLNYEMLKDSLKAKVVNLTVNCAPDIYQELLDSTGAENIEWGWINPNVKIVNNFYSLVEEKLPSYGLQVENSENGLTGYAGQNVDGVSRIDVNEVAGDGDGSIVPMILF